MSTITLKTSVGSLPGVGPMHLEALRAAGIETLEDLLLYLPFRYMDASQQKLIAHLQPNETASFVAEVVHHQKFMTRQRKKMNIVTLRDESGEMTLTFFNQPYVEQSLKLGEWYSFTGKTKEYKGKLQLTNPTYESTQRESIHTGRIVPQYPQTAELRTRWLRTLLFTVIEKLNLRLPEYLPSDILREENLLPREEASKLVHFPKEMDQAHIARRRLAFDELWSIFEQLAQQERERQKEKGVFSLSEAESQGILLSYQETTPFPLTKSQILSCRDILAQFSKGYPTYHVVQGEVGSGKTLVAALALIAGAKQGKQALYLAPTAILAQQHFMTLSTLAYKNGLTCSLWTSAHKDDGHADIIVGTHSLLAHQSKFQPGVVVIDEEHRFGVAQREQYWHHTPKPHIVSMTATPIPRTLATVLFGQQSTSYLELIPGKEKQIKTRVIPASKFRDHFSWLEKEVLTKKTQAFLIAPLISPSEAEGFESIQDATTLFEQAKKSLPKLKVGLLTGKDSAEKKKKILEHMAGGELDVLVATPVIEVGIDIPNTSIITITSADRFGLAQLHQLRGRVGRNGQASWCFLVPTPGSSGSSRLKALETLNDGQALAELDLQKRGVGEFLGTRQSGWDTLEIASWLDLELVKQVKRVQEKILEKQ
jgi:ATP-dependent DNA helicase RecG